MLILIMIVLGVLSLAFHKANKAKLCKMFRGFSIAIGIVVVAVLMMYIIHNSRVPDLNECRKEREAAQEQMRQLKKELIEKDVLDEEIVNQFLENYKKAENSFNSYSIMIEESEFYLEGGGKKHIEFWLFFNLF